MSIQRIIIATIILVILLCNFSFAYFDYFSRLGNYYHRSSSFLRTHYIGKDGIWHRIPKYGLNAKSVPSDIIGEYTNVDMLFGSLYFADTDYFLSGRNGLDIKINRVYSSNVSEIGVSASSTNPTDGNDPNNKGYLGAGWRWNLGRISGDSLIYYENGGSELLFDDIAIGGRKKNKNYDVINIDADTLEEDILLQLDGTKIIYDNYLRWSNSDWNSEYGGKRVIQVLDPTENSELNILYFPDSPLPDSMYDSADRSISFEFSSTDTTDLISTRLKWLKYRNHGGNLDSIEYVYDEDIDTSYTDNPLRMVVYPSDDTAKYAYTDSAYWDGDSSMHWINYRLSEITLPFNGRYVYDWGYFRERDTTQAAQYKWHVNVRRIIRISADSTSADTINFEYNYPANTSTETRVESSAIFPDGSKQAYSHSRVLPTPITAGDQPYGLLKSIEYFNDESDTTSLAYMWESYEQDYWPFSIGTYQGDSVYIPMLIWYVESYGMSPSYIYETFLDLTDFNPYTGTFGTICSYRDTTTVVRAYVDSTNRATLSSVDVKDGDTRETDHYWNKSTMKIDSTKTTINSDSRWTKYEYDSFGNMIKTIVPLGDTASILTIEYDTTSLKGCYPTKATDNFNVLWEKDYYLSTGQIKQSKNTNSDSTMYYYDTYDRLAKIKRPLESDTSLIRTFNRSSKAVIDSIKMSSTVYNVTTKFYDGFNRLIRTRMIDDDVDSVVTQTEYDFENKIKRSTRAYTSISDTAWTEYTYDAMDRIVRVDYPDGTSDSTFYDADSSSTASKSTKKIDTIDRVFTSIYNNRDELVKVKSDTLGQDSVLYEYTDFSRLSKLTDPRGLNTIYEYDNYGNITKDSTGDEGVRLFYYNSRNKLRFVKKAEGDWMYSKYDVIGRLIETGIADSIITDSVDIRNYPSSYRTIQVKYRYDEYQVSFPFIDSTINNPEGNLTIVDDDAGKTWFYYDDRNRLALKMVYIDGMSDSLKVWYEYGDADQLKKITYPDSTQISYTYYKSLRMKDYFVGAPGIHTDDQFKYNAWGGMEKINIDGDTTYFVDYDYNNMSMPTKIFAKKDTTGLWGRSYGYNNAHMIDLVKLLNNAGSPTNDTTRTYEYDYLYRLTEADLGPGGKAVRFGYDKSGNRLYKVIDDDTWGVDSTIYYYSYGSRDTLEFLTGYAGERDSSMFVPISSDSSISWYCNFSNVTGQFKIWSDDSIYVDITSDGSGSLTPVSVSPIYILLVQTSGEPENQHEMIEAWVRYPSGNKTAYGSNRLLSISGQELHNYQYNDNGCVVHDTLKSTEYFLDESNRLDSIIVDDYKRYVYYYDAAGRRVKKLFIEGIFCDSTEWSIDNHNDECEHDTGTCWFVPGDVDGDADCDSVDVSFLNNYVTRTLPWSPPPYPIFRADVNCDGYINGRDVTYLNNYLGGPGGAGPAPKCCYWIYTDTTATYYIYSDFAEMGVLAEFDESGSLIDNYIYANGLNPVAKYNPTDKERYFVRDVRGSVRAVLDSAGSYAASYDYYPFGSVLAKSGEDRYKYTHKELDEGYGVDLYYYGARYYDSELGRFMSPDPIKEYYNPYSYVANDPINLIDPDGKQTGGLGGVDGGGILPLWGIWDTGWHWGDNSDLNRVPTPQEWDYMNATYLDRLREGPDWVEGNHDYSDTPPVPISEGEGGGLQDITIKGGGSGGDSGGGDSNGDDDE